MSSGQRFTGRPYHAPSTDYWSAALVSENLVDALKIFERISPGGGGGGNGWPMILREFEDFLAQLEGGETELYAQRNFVRPILTADQITRVNDVIYWQAKYIKNQSGPGRILGIWLAAKVGRKKFTDECIRLRIPRATAYRARDRALMIITRGLIADEIKPFRMGRLR